jgi:hypothetical protein
VLAGHLQISLWLRRIPQNVHSPGDKPSVVKTGTDHEENDEGNQVFHGGRRKLMEAGSLLESP